MYWKRVVFCVVTTSLILCCGPTMTFLDSVVVAVQVLWTKIRGIISALQTNAKKMCKVSHPVMYVTVNSIFQLCRGR